MDLKALMQQLETINTTESVEETQVITQSVAQPVVESAESVFKSSIARSLAEEFGYELDEADPNDPNATAATAANTKAMQDARAKKDAASGQVVGSGTTPAPGGQAASPTAAKTATAPVAGAPAAGGVANPYQGADAAKFAAMSPEDQAWLTKGGSKPDINDEFILARAPNKGKTAGGQAASPAAASSQAVNPDSQQGQMLAAQTQGMNDPQSGVAGVTGGSEQDRKLAAQTAGMDAPASGGQAAASGAADPKKLARYKELIAKAKGGAAASPAAGEKRTPAELAANADLSKSGLEEGVQHFLNKLRLLEASALTPAEQQELDALHKELAGWGGVDPDVTAAVDDYKSISAGGAAASPAAAPAAAKKPAGAPAVSPAIVGYASSMGLYKNGKPDPEAIKKFQTDNGLKADGIIGPNTSGAILSAQKPGMAGSGRGGQGGPTATQAAQASNPKVAELDAKLAGLKKYPQMNAQIIARLEKEKAALTGSQAASPAATAAPAPTSSGGRPYTPPKQEESIVTQDNDILAMIRNIRV